MFVLAKFSYSHAGVCEERKFIYHNDNLIDTFRVLGQPKKFRYFKSYLFETVASCTCTVRKEWEKYFPL